MTRATENLLNLFKTIISAHVFILYYKVSNNYARALKDEKTFTSRRRIDYSRRAFPVHRFATFPYISASKLVLFFSESFESRPRLTVDIVYAEDTFHLEILSRAPPLIVEIVFPDDNRPRPSSTSAFVFKFKTQSSVLIVSFFTADIQRYIKCDPFFLIRFQFFKTSKSAEDAH